MFIFISSRNLGSLAKYVFWHSITIFFSLFLFLSSLPTVFLVCFSNTFLCSSTLLILALFAFHSISLYIFLFIYFPIQVNYEHEYAFYVFVINFQVHVFISYFLIFCSLYISTFLFYLILYSLYGP